MRRSRRARSTVPNDSRSVMHVRALGKDVPWYVMSVRQKNVADRSNYIAFTHDTCEPANDKVQ